MLSINRSRIALCLVSAALLFAVSRQALAGVPDEKLDEVFSQFTARTPGCSVGVKWRDDAPVYKAYGQSDLDDGQPNRADTIFEAGSVSKQFAAAAALILIQDGAVALDDDIRKFLPELKNYGAPITIAELLGHTSGLRDWGVIEALAGWPRGDRVYENADALLIAGRQSALNYAPGTEWSYTNTGFNLLAIIIERVSGRSLEDFSKARIFTPLGLSHTAWRDDFRRPVWRRATAYTPVASGYQQSMPFENAVGGGGLLTTTGDLLIWNEALTKGLLGRFVTIELQRPTVLKNGAATPYARGLFIGSHNGEKEIAHEGATAGYRAWLGRYPEKGLSIALLCNAGNNDVTSLAHAVADLYLSPSKATRERTRLTEAEEHSLAGWFADDQTGASLHLIARDDGMINASSNDKIVAIGNNLYRMGKWTMTSGKGALTLKADGSAAAHFHRVSPFDSQAVPLAQLTGHYRSVDSDADYVVAQQKDALSVTIMQRPTQSILCTPSYLNACDAPELGTIRFDKDQNKSASVIHIGNERVWDLPASRVKEAN